jgi:hypothetical protein
MRAVSVRGAYESTLVKNQTRTEGAEINRLTLFELYRKREKLTVARRLWRSASVIIRAPSLRNRYDRICRR